MTYLELFPIFVIKQTSGLYTLIQEMGIQFLRKNKRATVMDIQSDASRGLMTERARYLQQARHQRVNREECRVNSLHSFCFRLTVAYRFPSILSSDASTERWGKRDVMPCILL